MRIFMLLLAHLCAWSAETPTPTPTPTQNPVPTPTIDAATIKKAEAAADAYVQQSSIRPDPEVELNLAHLEIALLECQTLFDSKNALKAGEKYLFAVDLWKKIPQAQRPLLGERLRKADRSLLALSKKVLGEAAFDLGDPAANNTPTTTPNTAPETAVPAGQP